MSRTYRNIPYKHYWGITKEEAKVRWEEAKENPPYRYPSYLVYLERDYLLHGTESRNHAYPTHEYFNRAHRAGRSLEKDQLRPHIVLGEDYDFDDSHYRAKYKGVWWEIY